MSTSTETERNRQSFAETAMRLGGKSEEEARRMGAVDKADEQVESLFAAQYQTVNSPIHKAVWDGKVPLELFMPPAVACRRAVRRGHGTLPGDRPPAPRGTDTLYDDKGKVAAGLSGGAGPGRLLGHADRSAVWRPGAPVRAVRAVS